MKAAWRALMVLPLLLLAVLSYLVFAERGARVLLNVLQSATPLEIQYSGGSLAGTLKIERLSLQTGELDLAIDNLALKLNPRCLWLGKICFTQFTIENLELVVTPDKDGPVPAKPVTVEKIASSAPLFPVRMQAESFQIAAATIRWPGGQWQQGATTANIAVQNTRVKIRSARLEQPRLTLTASAAAGDAHTTSMPVINLPLRLVVEQAELNKPSVDLNGDIHALDSIHLGVRWHGHNLKLSRLKIDGGDRGKISLSGAVSFTGTWPLKADLNAQFGRSTLPPLLHGRDVLAQLQGDLGTLALQVSSPGSPAVTAQAVINTLDAELPFSLSMEAALPEKARASDYFDELPSQLSDTRLLSPLMLEASGSLVTQSFSLEATIDSPGYEALALSLSAQHTQNNFTIDSLFLRDVAHANQLRATGEVSYAEGLKWSLALESSGLDLPRLQDLDFASGRLAGQIETTGHILDDNWSVHIAEVDLRGDINKLPASLEGFGGLSEGMSLSQSNLKAKINGTTVSFETAGHDQAPGHLHLYVSDLRRWLPESSGRLKLDADIGAKGLQYHVSGTLERAHWGDLRIDSATVGGSYRHADEHPFEVDVALADATLGSIAFTSLQLVASGDEKARSLTISSEGEVTGRLAINGAGKNGEWQGALTPTSLQTRLGVWELADPVRLTASESTKEATLASHCWLHEHARICSEDWALGAEGTGGVEVTGKLALLQPLLPQNVELDGEIDTQLEVSWGPSSETRIAGRAYIDSPSITRDVGEGERATAVWDKTEAMLTVDKRGLQLELGLSRDNRNEMLIELSLPPERDGALTGLMQFDHMQLAPLAPLFPQFSHIEGHLSGSVLLTGSLKKPLAKGKLTLVGRQLSLAGNPSKLEDLNLTVVLQGDRARINGKGLLGGGILSMAGSVRQDPELTLELSLKGENHTLLYPPSTQLRASENLSITLENGIVAITGDITVHEGTLEFEQLPPGGVSLSSDIVEVDYIGVPVGEKYPINTSMDIGVQIEDKFILTGTLLKTAIAGDLSLRQLPSEPLQIFGTLNTVGGEVRAYGRRLLVRRGVFNFSGPPENPTLDFQADRQISGSNIRVGIQLSGRLEEDLNLDIYSEPAMSREDAISYLIRGRSVDADTSGDGTAMALSLAGGVVSRSALVTRLNSVPGVSDIALGADGSEEETTATVSGYIGERIFLSYGFGIYEPINVLTARLYLSTRLWLEVVSRLENSADLYYSFDLD